MDQPVDVQILLRLLLAIALGAAIGLERTLHGRSAGFRTHALVSLASCLLMLMTVYEALWFPQLSQGRVILDPTRMAQGIMTGIGFLGGGAILREGFAVRGLTTAASVWVTSTIGILVGVGFLAPALAGTAFTIVVLAMFRWLEDRLPTAVQARVTARFRRQDAPEEAGLSAVLHAAGARVFEVSVRLDASASVLEYRAVVRTRGRGAIDRLARGLEPLAGLLELRVSPLAE